MISQNFLSAIQIPTPIGTMIAVSDQNSLHILQFEDSYHFNHSADLSFLSLNQSLPPPLSLIQTELKLYFSGQLKTFNTPLSLVGSPFQKMVWSFLSQVPYGQTISYKEQAQRLQRENSCRAIANANGQNPFAIILPCHRVVRQNRTLGGYRGGIWRKEWLLSHEKKYE